MAKQFRVEEILTTDDGRIVLNGPDGSVDIFRHDNNAPTSTAVRSTVQLLTRAEERREANWHAVKVADIPKHAFARHVRFDADGDTGASL